MDPISAVCSAITAIRLLDEMISKIKQNKKSCKFLIERCKLFLPKLNGMMEVAGSCSEATMASVVKLNILLTKVNNHCKEYCEKNWAARALDVVMSSSKSDMESFHREINLLLQDTAFQIAIDSRLWQVSFEEKFTEDMYEMREFFGDMFAANASRTNNDLKREIGELRTAMESMLLGFQPASCFSSDLRQIRNLLQKQDAIQSVVREAAVVNQAQPLSPQNHGAPSKLSILKGRIAPINLSALVRDKNKPPVGSGSSADVYSCKYDRAIHALKVFRGVDNMTEKELTLICREVLIMQLASHENIIGFRGADMNTGMILLEYAECSLHGVLHLGKPEPQGNEIDFSWKLGVLNDVSSALRFLHHNKITHRDIKTHNILLVLGSQGRTIAKVSDLGLATADTLRSIVESSHSGANTAVGTSAYQAPELFEDRIHYSPKVDIYAFGVVLNEVLTGERPFEGRTIQQIIRKVMQHERPNLFTPSGASSSSSTSHATHAAEVKLVQLIQSCWGKEAHKRPTANEICTVLVQLESEFTQEAQSTKQSNKEIAKLTALTACEEGDLLAVQDCIDDSGVDVNCADELGQSLLHWACYGCHFHLTIFLISRGSSVKSTTKEGLTPLHWACQGGHLNIVTCLIMQKAEKDAEDHFGWTPLQLASAFGHLEIVKYLVSIQCNLRHRNSDGYTALQLAEMNFREDVEAFLNLI